mmetsp:Transcript_5609/g.16664  ORF Transcript_5609/g.16664 Transcript_5609/m.16664 type:complete len:219 (-) Transcript_5609:713-1369(-)
MATTATAPSGQRSRCGRGRPSSDLRPSESFRWMAPSAGPAAARPCPWPRAPGPRPRTTCSWACASRRCGRGSPRTKLAPRRRRTTCRRSCARWPAGRGSPSARRCAPPRRRARAAPRRTSSPPWATRTSSSCTRTRGQSPSCWTASTPSARCRWSTRGAPSSGWTASACASTAPWRTRGTCPVSCRAWGAWCCPWTPGISRGRSPARGASTKSPRAPR